MGLRKIIHQNILKMKKNKLTFTANFLAVWHIINFRAGNTTGMLEVVKIL